CGVPGVPPARVLVIGSGIVGSNATFIAVGMGADVTVTAAAPDSLRTGAGGFGPPRGPGGARRQGIVAAFPGRGPVRRAPRGPGRGGAEADLGRNGEADEARIGDRRRGDRPGW